MESRVDRIIECPDDVVWVSDFITREIYKEWKIGIYMLACGLGRGKTRFALKEYCNFWLEKHEKGEISHKPQILYLCNRNALKNSIKMQVEKYVDKEKEKNKEEKIVTIWNYQQIQAKIRKKEDMGKELEKYDAILCDEAHYFISDSFNRFTETSLEALITAAEKVPVIFITATHDEILSYLDKYHKNVVKKIYMLATDCSHIKNICFYDKEELFDLIEAIIDKTPTNKAEAEKADNDGKLERAIYFCNSINQQKLICKRYLEKHKQSYYNKSRLRFMIFQQSRQNQHRENQYGKNPHISNRKLKAIPLFVEHRQEEDKNKEFKCDDSGSYAIPEDRRLLVSTKCLDNGIDIIDPSVKHIIIDITDIVSVIQCLGRKRADRDENGDVIKNCNLYFQNYQRNSFTHQEYITRKEIEQAQIFDGDDDKKKWFDKYGGDRELNNKLFYVDWNEKENRIEVKLNKLYYEKLQCDNSFFENVKSGETTYKREILNRLGISKNDARIVSSSKMSKNLENTELVKKSRKETKAMLRKYSDREREMNANEREEFINEMYRLNKRFENASGNKLKQIGAINEWLKKWKYPYEIKTKRHAVKDGRQPTYWIVKEVKPKSE